MSTLLDVVDELTLTKPAPVIQDTVEPIIDPTTGVQATDDEGNPRWHKTGTRREWVSLAPLLTQLQDAITGSIGGPAGKGGLAHERSVLDADALHKAMVIASQIGDWCRVVGARHDRADMCGSLRAWYAARLATNPSEVEDEWFRGQLQGWVRFVWSKLDPVRERELPDACPVCGAVEWWRDGERFLRPLVVRYRSNDADMIERARAVCRACAKVWGVRELAFELEGGAA